MQIFNDILLSNPNLASIKEFDKRLEILLQDLFAVSFSRCSRSLLYVDHLTYALRLAQIKLRLSKEEWDEREFDFLLRGSEGAVGAKTHPDFDMLVLSFGERIATDIVQLSTISAFKEFPSMIVSKVSEWQQVLTLESPEERISSLWKDDKCLCVFCTG